MAKKTDRFEVIYTQGTLDVTRILRDNETGMLYLQMSNGYCGSITPLLDKDGKPARWTPEDGAV